MAEEKHPGGRPALFDDPEALAQKVDEYFIWVKGEQETTANASGEIEIKWKRLPEHVTVTGMALFLGFESRQSVYDYEEKGQFSYIIKKARMRVEAAYEQNLHGTSPTGSIFALKNMGWSDASKTEITGKDGSDLIPPAISITVVKPGGPEKVQYDDNGG